jgi:hypothetical protein
MLLATKEECVIDVRPFGHDCAPLVVGDIIFRYTIPLPSNGEAEPSSLVTVATQRQINETLALTPARFKNADECAAEWELLGKVSYVFVPDHWDDHQKVKISPLDSQYEMRLKYPAIFQLFLRGSDEWMDFF